MIGIIFNHDMGDDPYNQKALSSGAKKLEAVLERLDEDLLFNLGKRRSGGLVNNNEDEYVIVQHTAQLSREDKAEIVECIKEMLLLKKSACKEVAVGGVIVFEKVEEENCFTW